MTDYQTAIGPSIWAVSDGRAGNTAQVRSVMAALSDATRWMQIAHIQGQAARPDPIVLTPRAPWSWWPGTRWPFARLALPKTQRDMLSEPWPDVWIAAGRRSAPYSRAIKDWSGGKTVSVHILNPRSDPSDFDLVVTPEHDGLRAKNVLSTVGSPSYFSEAAIEDASLAFAELADIKERSVMVILGGDSNTHTFTNAAAQKLISQLNELSTQGYRLRVSASRRTPGPVIVQMRAFSDKVGASFWAGPDDGPNPYLGWLLYSSAAIVTEDSANMLSDAAWHGLPVHIARLEGRSDKFDRLHASLINRGCARWFEGRVESWAYEPLDEAGRVADSIIHLLLNKYPQPELKSIVS